MNKKIDTYHNKNVIVMGLARSGVGAANLLVELGAHVWITDNKPASELTDFINRLHPSVHIEAGMTPENLLKETDLVIISPGIALTNSFVQQALSKGIPLIGELELAYSAAHAPFIAITGTNGKTTTTMLTDHLLKNAGLTTLLCGNIGNSVCEEILNSSFSQEIDYLVTEVSSFQLETIKEFRPRIAAILNTTPDHLNRHGSIRNYIDMKARISLNQKSSDYLILNGKDSEVSYLSNKTSARVLLFGNKVQDKSIYRNNKWIEYQFPDRKEKIIPISEIHLTGEHNKENIMASSAIALLAGVSNDVIRAGIKTFKLPPHRLEKLGSINGITFYNDSKATNIDAVVRALENFSSVVLLMGGRDKDGDFSVLKSLIGEKVRFLVLYGESKSLIAEVLASETRTALADSFRDAVLMAYNNAQSGDTVLLSPGCASFDMFKNYSERGERFKEIVLEISSY